MSAARIAVIGAAGKMGRAIIKVLSESTTARLAAAAEHAGAPSVGQDAGALAGVANAGVAVRDKLPAAGEADVWIDFSSPKTSVANARAAADAKAGFVLGTTGLSASDKATLAQIALSSPTIFAANYSVGVNVLIDIVARTAKLLGPDYDIEMVEAHHRMKRDAPSGTALRLAEALAAATGRYLDKTAVYARQGDVGPRTKEEIGIQTIRGGDVVGDHTAFFLGIGDRIEITHRASSRETFAQGAVRAAQWLVGKPAGKLYDMRDVLGL